VLATSGTAVANHLPAVVEADLSLVPLIAISADRPPDLLHVGANQTMDQPGIFGGRVRWSCSIPAAEQGVDSNAYWRSTVSQAVARALGHGGRPGPVHLNVAFREPTVPVQDDGRTRADRYPFSIEGRRAGAPWQVQQRSRPGPVAIDSDDLLVGGRGLILAGEGDYDPGAVSAAAARLGWPVLATATSRLRPFDASARSRRQSGQGRAERPDRRTHLASRGPGPGRPLGGMARPAATLDPCDPGRARLDPGESRSGAR
jgi:2-succinyl-5-enolpyruvyl-6-hydroxy-3-cyclohexene-1-carboxylate synthase